MLGLNRLSIKQVKKNRQKKIFLKNKKDEESIASGY